MQSKFTAVAEKYLLNIYSIAIIFWKVDAISCTFCNHNHTLQINGTKNSCKRKAQNCKIGIVKNKIIALVIFPLHKMHSMPNPHKPWFFFKLLLLDAIIRLALNGNGNWNSSVCVYIKFNFKFQSI